MNDKEKQIWLNGFLAHRDGIQKCSHGYGKGDHHWESGDCLADDIQAFNTRMGL